MIRYRIVKEWVMQPGYEGAVSSRLGFRRDRRGSVAVMAGAGIIPLIVGIGVATDMARLAMAQNTLQSAADEAALAGATAYGATGTVAQAQAAVTNYFNRAIALQPALLTNAPAPTVTAAPGSFNGTIAANNVTVAASATMPTTLLGIVGLHSVTLTATATASNPWGNTTNTWQPVVSSGFLGSSAYDWNSVYVYPVQMNGSTPNFAVMPPVSQLYEVATNCNTAGSSSFQAGAPCTQSPWNGTTIQANNTLPAMAANVPLSVVMFNMTSGTRLSGQGYSANQYGSAASNMRVLATAALTFGLGPAAIDDQNSNPALTPQYYVKQVWPTATAAQLAESTTTYSTVNSSSTPDCALIIQQIDPTNPPTLPPVPAGTCYSLTDPNAGLQYANLTCSQIAGRTFVYWFNDMGGGTDDKDYNDMVVSLTCNPVGANANGGNFKSSGQAPISGLTTALIQ